MLKFDRQARSIAASLINSQVQTGVEHYWAIDIQGRVYENSGNAGSVSATTDLEKRYDDPGESVVYHHSHPDERALSPSDISLIARPGVKQVWAHTPQWSAYGIELMPGICKQVYLSAFQKLHSFMDPNLVSYPHGQPLSSKEFEELRDLVAITALEDHGWISAHIQLSDTMRRTIFDNLAGYGQLLGFFKTHLSKA